MRKILIAALSGLVVAGCNRIDSDKFDLSCTGTLIQDDRSDNTTKNEPYALQLRLSIKEMEWCAGKCEEASKITRIDDTNVYLQDRIVEGFKQTLAVNRYTGELYDLVESPEYNAVFKGAKCQKKPFSGFPKRQF